MKKQSTLIRRALLFTAIVLTVAIAVGIPTFLLLNNRMALNDAQKTLLSYARTLAADAVDGVPDSGEVSLLESMNGTLWISADGCTHEATASAHTIPEAAAALLPEVEEGYEYLGSAEIDGTMHAFAAVPIRTEDGAAAMVAALPALGNSNLVLCLVIALICSLIAACAAGFVLIHTLLIPVVRPIGKLRDVAVAVAEGDLDARANERAPGELGELAKAVNNVSTQLARNMYALILERNRLKHMIDGLSEAIVAIDNEGHVTHTNPALEQMFPKQQLMLHLPDSRMKIIPDKTIWEDFDSVIQNGEPIARNLEVRDMVLRLSITPTVDEIGTTVGAVGLISDITQMERLERTRREYVSNVSHEMRTPLTAMRALVEPLKEGMVKTEEDRMRYYDIIMREILRLSRLINDQLELSRLQSGTVAIEKSRMALDDLVYDVCDRYSMIAQEHGLELKLLTDMSDCPSVFANADRVEQMLIILLDNAIKYTEEGSVSVSATWNDEKVILSVKDTGVGIDEEDLPYVFDRFYKVDKAHSGKGSGLGLSIARELLKRMDEDIWVSSEKGVGSEFSFTITLWAVGSADCQ